MQAAEPGEMVVLAGSGQVALVGTAPPEWASGTVSLDSVRILNLGPGEALVHGIGFRLPGGPVSHCERAWRVPPGGERTVMSDDLHHMWLMRLSESDPGAADAFGQADGRALELVVEAFTSSGRAEAVWPCRLQRTAERLCFQGEPA